MYNAYEKWPDFAEEFFNSDLKSINFKNPTHLVFVGMGGSGAICDIFSAILSKTNIHTEVVKGYHLPKTVDSKTLVIIASVSGDTDETLSVLSQAKNITKKIICFSSGGKMENFCKKNKIEFRKIPMIHSPRASFVAYLYSMLKVLLPILPIKKSNIHESIEGLKQISKKILINNLSEKNPSISLAKWIKGIPIIYYPLGLQSAAIRFKNSLQENSKHHAITEDVIESCHNGIVSWEKKSNITPILIQGKDDHVKTKQRWKIIKQYFKENDIEYKEIFSGEGDILTKLIQLVYLLDLSTIYLATIKRIDPSPVNSIDYIKRKLNKKN
ncbi:MAG: SIS domain-containing protein [Nitrosopumilus sp.]|nr:SIS domain-containing protein [Nitrosopumilus sp.]